MKMLVGIPRPLGDGVCLRAPSGVDQWRVFAEIRPGQRVWAAGHLLRHVDLIRYASPPRSSDPGQALKAESTLVRQPRCGKSRGPGRAGPGICSVRPQHKVLSGKRNWLAIKLKHPLTACFEAKKHEMVL